MLNARNGVFAFQIFQLRVDIVISQSRVSQYLKSQIVVALTRTAIQPPVELRVHTAEHILTADSGGVIVRLPLRTQQAVSANPFDLPRRELIAVVDFHFLSCFKEVDSGFRIIYIKVVVVVLELYGEINLRHICPDGRDIALKGRSHYGVIVVHETVAESDRVDTHPTMGVLHTVNDQFHRGRICQHFFGAKQPLRIIAKLDNLSATAHQIEIYRVIFTEIDSNTLEIRSGNIEIDCKLELRLCEEFVADDTCVKVSIGSVLSRKKEHCSVNFGEILLKGSVDGIIGLFGQDICGVGVVGEITLLDLCFCLCFLIEQTERNHNIRSLAERGFHALFICL